MVRAPLSARAAEVVTLMRHFLCVALVGTYIVVHAQTPEPTGASAIAETVLWGFPMAPAERTATLPADVQKALVDYRQRERTFRSALTPPPGATPEERALFEKRVGIERVLFCLFPRRDIARVASAYASDADISYEWEGFADAPRREAAFIDGLFRDLQQTWLAPYLNLIAGHRKLCASQLEGADSEAGRRMMAEDARRQIARARDGGLPLIRAAAEHLLSTGRCTER